MVETYETIRCPHMMKMASKKQITFRSTKKENNHKLNADAFLRLYVDQDDNNKK